MKIDKKLILNDFLAFTKSIESISESKLISFSFPIEKFDSLSVINKLNSFHSDIFFFRNPNNTIAITGLNSALELTSNGDNKFIFISEKINYWEKNLIKNWNEIKFFWTPLLCCTVKFDSLRSSQLWEEFESLRLYIPEIILFYQNNTVTGFYNFIFDSYKSVEEISTRFLKYLENIEETLEESIQVSNDKIISSLNSVKEELKDWQKIFNKAISILNSGNIEKLVLSRAYIFAINNPVNWSLVLNKLINRFNDCYLFFIKRDNTFFFGSSPEMFLKVAGNIAEVESVAGSAPRGEKTETDHQYEKFLITNKKNHQEHLFVSDFISEILIRYSDNVRIIEEKQIRKLDNIQHLITRITAVLHNKKKLFELIDSLFPTPAVCGVPKELAMNFIRTLESHDRGLYSGIVGIMDFKGSCELAVSIRSALVKDNIVTAYAGCGLVKGSNSDEEFLETNLKLNTILSLFSDESTSK